MSTSTPPLNDLVTKIRSTHLGDYDDMDDATLTQKTLAKYPQYSDLAAPKIASPIPPKGTLPNGGDTGEGPIAQGMTSLETHLVDTAKSLFHPGAYDESIGPPENAQPQKVPLSEAAKTLAGGINPIVRNDASLVNPNVKNPDKTIDYGATAANILPMIIDPGMSGIGESPLIKTLGSAADATAAMRNRAAQKIVGPLAYENVGETAADNRMGANPERGIVDEGLVGSKSSLVKQASTRLGELKSAANNILQNHPASRQLINAEPIIDDALDKAVIEAQKVGGDTSRLEQVRDALKTKYGKLQGTPLEINNLKSDIQDHANNLGAYKNTQPVEASAAAAMGDAARGIKNAVNAQVPEVTDLNQRMQDLKDAQTGIQRKVNQSRGEDMFAGGPFEGTAGKILQRTVGSAPVRTGIARVLNAGNVKNVPAPTSYIPPVIRGLLKASPTPLPSPMEPTDPTLSPPPPILQRVIEPNSANETAQHMNALDQAKAELGPDANISKLLQRAATIQQEGATAAKSKAAQELNKRLGK